MQEKAMAPHSSILAWKIPWTEEPGRLQSMGSLRVRHDWATSLSLSCIREGNGNPLRCSCLENPRDGGAWWAAIYGVTQSRTRLKWLSVAYAWCNYIWFTIVFFWYNPYHNFMKNKKLFCPNLRDEKNQCTEIVSNLYNSTQIELEIRPRI